MRKITPHSSRIFFRLARLLLLTIWLIPGHTFSQTLAFANKATKVQPDKTLNQQIKDFKLLKEVLTEIEAIHKVHFGFESKIIEDKRVDKNLVERHKHNNIDSKLSSILQPLKLNYKKLGDSNYVIYPEEEKVLPQNQHKDPSKKGQKVGYRQAITISGTVISSENREPLPGVSILLKGTATGAVTDADGRYTISAPDGDAILIFSFIGFKSEEVAINGRSVIDIALVPDVNALEEIVVVGYGTQKKSDLTGAITSISGDDLNVTRESNPLNALAGKVAGLDVGISSGQPGSSPSLLVRGRSSLNFSNEPLIVLDGIPLEGGLNDINSADIASVEVLKDASSAAIYGARGANGVILITTKRGKPGKARITFDTYYGFATLKDKYDVFTAEEYANLRREAKRAADEGTQLPGTLPIPSVESSLEPLQYQAYLAGVNADYMDLGIRNGKQANHQLGVSGGSEKVRYALSLSYFDQEGVFQLSDYTRTTFRANIDVNATDKLKFGISQQGNYARRNNYDPFNNLIRQSPLASPYDEQGLATLDPLADGLLWNPLSNETPGNYIDVTPNYRYLANIFASYQFIDGFKYTLNVQPQFELIHNNDFRASQSASRAGALTTASKDQRTNLAYTIENIVNYNHLFNDVHSLDATLLYSFQKTKRDYVQLGVSGTSSDSQLFNNLGDATQIDSRASSLEEEGWASYMARFNYSFKNKYLLTLTGRYDGSSKLSKGSKWGLFPSASFAWRIINEDFMKNQTFITDLKVRSGYGQVGRNPIGAYSTFGSLERFEGSFGNQSAIGFIPNQISNPDLKWERTTTFDLGVDFALAKSRISGSVDYYIGRTTDLLLNRVLPASSAFSNILQNVGETRNSGIEVVLSTRNIDAGGFKWTTDLNFSANQNKIVKLLDRSTDDIGNGWFIGKPLNVLYDRVFAGIWQQDEAELAKSYGRMPGDIKLADINNDGKLNDEDRQIIGQRDPKWMGGITSRMQYKGFDFTVAAYTRQGQLTNSQALANVTLSGRYNGLNVDYWTPENPSNSFPRPNRNRERPLDNQVLGYVDGSFVRIRNITLGYNFKSNIASKLGMENLRVYVTAQNPLLFSAYQLKGYDPEVGDGGDFAATPTTVLFGLNLSL